MFELMENETVAVLKTEKGRFVISMDSREYMTKNEGISISYHQVGKPIRDLAVITHDTRTDTLKTLVFENPWNAERLCIVHDRLSKELTQFEETIKKAKLMYYGINLEIHYRNDEEIYELCYVGSNDHRYTIQEFQFLETSAEDIKYCAIHHGLDIIKD